MSLKIEDTEYKLDKDNIQGSGEIWTSQNLQCQNLQSRIYGTSGQYPYPISRGETHH